MRPPLSITTLMRFSYSGLCELVLKTWTEISSDTIINGFVKAGITEKTTTIEIVDEDELVTEDIESGSETLPDDWNRAYPSTRQIYYII